MKRITLISITFLLIISTGADTCLAFRDEHDGYNGFKWGTDLQSFLNSKKVTLKKEGDIYFGDRIGKIDVDIGYEFFNDKLFGVTIDFPPEKRDIIVNYFTILHGKPTLRRGKDIYWVGTSTKIVIKKIDVSIMSIALEREYLKEKEKKASSR